MCTSSSPREILRYLCLLTAFCATLFLQSCSSVNQAPDPAAVRLAILEAREEEQKLVRSTIGDPQRLGAFLALIDQRDEVLQEYAAKIGKYRRDFALLNADYDAQRSDFEKLVSEYNEQRTVTQQELLELIESMKRSTTSEEWRAISEFQKKRLHPRRLAYDGGLTEET